MNFQQYLESVFNGDEDKIDFVRRLIGYSLLEDDKPEDVFVIFRGRSRSGKDTFMRIIQSCIKENAAPVSNKLLTKTTPLLTGMLDGLKIAYFQGVQLNKINTAQLKHLIGDKKLIGRKLYHDPYTFNATHTLFMITNEEITEDTFDVTINDRIALVEFTQRFVDDPMFENEHQAEKDVANQVISNTDVMKWIYSGFKDIRRDGFEIPDRFRI